MGLFAIGKDVVIQSTVSCITCITCDPRTTWLEKLYHKGGFGELLGRGSGFGDSIVVLENAISRLLDNVPLDIGALIQPPSVV